MWKRRRAAISTGDISRDDPELQPMDVWIVEGRVPSIPFTQLDPPDLLNQPCTSPAYENSYDEGHKEFRINRTEDKWIETKNKTKKQNKETNKNY